MKKATAGRVILTALILMALAAMWGVQSDLAYYVAQQRPILLGRYTLSKTISLLMFTPVLLMILRAMWKKKVADPRARRIERFKAASATLSIIIAIMIADAALRTIGKHRAAAYVGTATSYHRTPNQVFTGVFHDFPEFAFCYPNATPGYPPVEFTLSVDSNGFRNPVQAETYDWIVLGDSFAEGSSVSDFDGWVPKLAQMRGVKIYNLGMSGGSPLTYLDTLEKFGTALKPGVALYMLYEGNDFRDSNFRQEKISAVEDSKKARSNPFKTSPLRTLLKNYLIKHLGPSGKNRFRNDPEINNPSHSMYPVAWLPFRLPDGGAYGYAFDVKRLEQHYITAESFNATKACRESIRLLQEAIDVCRANDIQLVVLYAPDKPHILIHDIAAQVPAGQVRAFLRTRLNDLPPAPEFMDALIAGTAVREKIFRDLCQANEVQFISLTEPLRQQTRAGVRTYYTYDQHWTPEGHDVVADFLHETIRSQ
ncbi:MAG: hypothetical protein WC959_00610 [Kiritimatiellales bacterium]